MQFSIPAKYLCHLNIYRTLYFDEFVVHFPLNILFPFIFTAFMESLHCTHFFLTVFLTFFNNSSTGMRAVKSVLLASASLRRLYSTLPEAQIVLRAIVDVNLPKFLEQDVSLFIGIYMDLFPGTELPEVCRRL